MDKRALLQGLALTIAAGGLSHIPAFANEGTWKQQFHRALQKHPWLLGVRTAQKPEYSRRLLRVTGRIPERLRGSLYRNGPARHEVGDSRYHHWFDGDGMVHRFYIDGQQVWHQGRFVETKKFLKEQGGVMHEQAFGTVLPGMNIPIHPDAVNVANINIIEHNKELLALWEGGSAYRLDAETLETLGLKHWSPETEGAPFGAHPRRDLQGNLWNFGYAPYADALVLYGISAEGVLKKRGFIPIEHMPMVHDFMITENYLVFVLPPFRFTEPRAEKSFLDQFAWLPELGGEVLIVSKETLKPVAKYAIPTFWVFHFSNAYESGEHEIRFQAPLYPNPGVMTEALRHVMRGEQTEFAHSQFYEVKLNWQRETFDMTAMGDMLGAEFPIIDPRRQGEIFENTYLLENRGRNLPVFDTLVHLSRRGTKKYQYGEDYLVEEHVFVPDPASTREGQGWLLGTALDHRNKRTVLSIFDAENVGAGPIAQASMDAALPLGLHGNFIAAT